MGIIVTREEFYQKVWEMPLSKLATQYGTTVYRLKNFCRVLNISLPPSNYWLRVHKGKEVAAAPPLPPADQKTPASVHIEQFPPPVVAELRARAKSARARFAALTVPERLEWDPHPIATRMVKRERPNPLFRTYPVPDPHKRISGEFSECQRRQERFLDTLFRELQRHGFKINEGRPTFHGNCIYPKIGGVELPFRLREKLRQVRRPPTKKERRESYLTDTDLVRVFCPSGLLVFEFLKRLPSGLRSCWRESPARPMEKFLPDIVAAFVVGAPARIEEDRRLENRWRRCEAAVRRKERRNHEWERFLKLASDWQQVQLVYRFLDALKAEHDGSEEVIGGWTVEQWIEWAEIRLKNRDPLANGVESVFRRITEYP